MVNYKENKDFLEGVDEEKEYGCIDDIEDLNYLEEKSNIFSFDGLYNDCYIRIEGNEIRDVVKSLIEIYEVEEFQK